MTAQGGKQRASGRCQWPDSARTAPEGRRKGQQVSDAGKPDDNPRRQEESKRAVSGATKREGSPRRQEEAAASVRGQEA